MWYHMTNTVFVCMLDSVYKRRNCLFVLYCLFSSKLDYHDNLSLIPRTIEWFFSKSTEISSELTAAQWVVRPPPPHPPPAPSRSKEPTKITLMTEVGALAWWLAWSCATLAMLANVLNRFIWPIAMETEAGARLAGIRGCDIIIKGNWSRTKERMEREQKQTWRRKWAQAGVKSLLCFFKRKLKVRAAAQICSV